VSRGGSAHPDDAAIEIRNGSCGWTADTALLRDVNVVVRKGAFVVVHGPVGAGKSSLCLALLGEMEKLAGDVFVRGRVAYYAQQT
jgi:ABC-type Mn2+/Zn2+ transport system ATPase subunit